MDVYKVLSAVIVVIFLNSVMFGYSGASEVLDANSGVMDIIVTEDGNIIVLGNSDLSLGMMKLNQGGETLWKSPIFIGINGFHGTVIESTNNELFIVYESYPELYLTKSDQDGIILWNKTIERPPREAGLVFADSSTELIQLNNGNLVFGFLVPINSTYIKSSIIIFDEQGSQISSQDLIGDERFYIQSIIRTSDGGFSVLGLNSISYSLGNFEIYKFDMDGVLQWNSTYDLEGRLGYGNFAQLSNEEYILVSTNSNDWVPKLLSTFSNGTIKSEKNLDFLNLLNIASIGETTDGNIFISGSNILGNYEYNATLVNIDQEGNLIWTKQYEEFDFLNTGITLENEGYLLGGYSIDETVIYPYNPHIIKSDLNGHKIWDLVLTHFDEQIIYNESSSSESLSLSENNLSDSPGIVEFNEMLSIYSIIIISIVISKFRKITGH